MSMSDDSLKSMPPPASIIPKEEAQFVVAPKQASAIDVKTGQPRRGRGRPAGSRNKVRPPDGGVNPVSRITVPSSGKRETPSTNDDSERKKEEKKLRAEQYSVWINQELNDKLFMLLIGASNGMIKPENLYKEGRVPPKAQGNPNLTDMGNAIAIPADVADSWGKLIAELTYTDVGKNLVKATDNHGLVILMAAVTAVFSTYRYGQTLKPYIKMIQQIQASQNGQKPEGEE